MLRIFRLVVPIAVASAFLIAGCAAAPPADTGPGPLRVQVRLAQPLADGPAIAAAAAAASGVPVRYLAAGGSDWHALALDCAGAADCQAALEQLRSASRRFSAVEIDTRKRIVAPHY